MSKRIRLILIALLAWVFSTSVNANETVYVGFFENPPEIFKTPDGSITGLFPELLNLVAIENGWQVEYVSGTWRECVEWLRSGKIDLIPSIAVTKERQSEFTFSDEPFLINWGTVVTRSDMPILSLTDLDGKIIAMMEGCALAESEQGIKEQIRTLGLNCSFIEVEDYREVLLLVDSKQADAGAVSRFSTFLQDEKLDIKPSQIMFAPCNLTFATRRNYTRGSALVEKI
jgi:ABC-type amino acid transport substrate-binding protein